MIEGSSWGKGAEGERGAVLQDGCPRELISPFDSTALIRLMSPRFGTDNLSASKASGIVGSGRGSPSFGM